MKPSLDDLDRQVADQRLRDRDRHREPRQSRRELALQRRWAFQASVIDNLNELAVAGVLLQPPVDLEDL